MKIGYGYKRQSADLTAAGAEKVYIDLSKSRPFRDEMLQFQIREGDEVLVLYLRDLGGSPVADRVWREKIEALGATVTECRPVKPVRRVGRPEKIEWANGTAKTVRALWHGYGTETVRLASIAGLLGYEVGKGLLNGRFGPPSNPKV
jgi:hypothetical protein